MVFWKKKAAPTTQSDGKPNTTDSEYGLKSFADPSDGEIESVLV